ncbi:hypothetical protein SAMN05421813_12642 [Daejeonella rubra]|uniref:Uncharacterized protein n=1 Tax=Daejeonella rubra TaxID=990371 RepID=A0A1G9WQP1_9SPHI|nr:hypothetical protein [Daejeonella rubra]SDM86852.1 hypothetical protein SAMN05421813_12642 [Daejeonella rubra]
MNGISSVLSKISGSVSLFVKLSLVLTLLSFNSSALKAQSSDSLIVLEPSRRIINASNEELIDLTLKLVNRKSVPLSGVININLESSMNLISKNKTAVNIQPGDSLFIPVKVFVTKKTTSGKVHVIRFNLSDTENNLLLATESTVQVSVKRNVNMFALVSSILLDVTSDSIRIPVRISNPGNTAQRITMINRFPPVFQNEAFHSTLEFVIQPSADTLITITKPVTRKMFASEGFDVTFTGLYSNGDVFGMAYVRIQSGRSDRAYRDPLQSDNYNANSISLSSQSMFSDNQSYLLYGQGDLELKSGQLGYSLDYTKWQNSYSPSMMRNTWVSYESNNMGITAGNINRNMDINLSGRGANVFMNDTTNNDSYEVGYLDGNSNLIGQDFYNFMPTGSAGWGSYTHRKENSEFSTSVIYEINPMLNANSAILGNTYTLTKFKGLRIQANLSAGNTSQYDSTSIVKASLASGLNITGTIKKFAISSSNYFSTGYYPGMRRGALSFNERLTWLRESSNVWVGFDYNYYAPKNFTTFQLYMPRFSTMRAEVGMSGTVLKKMVTSVSPLFFRETNNSFRFSGSGDVVHNLSYWNLNASINYPIANNHYLSVNTESGFYNTSFDDKTRFHFRSNLNYKKGIFNLSSTLQFGTFYIGEAVNNYLRSQESPRILSIIPTVRKSFYRNKLRTEAGVAFMNNSSYGSSSFLTGRAEYDVLPKTSFYSSINHNRFNGYQFSILEVGLTQKLSLPKVGATNSDLEVIAYRDMNQNNIFDQGDQRADGHLLYINDVAFIADASGSVVYKKLPLDNYRVSITNDKGWYAPDQYIRLEKKKHRLEIPLKRTGTLKGSLVYSFDEFSYEINRNLQGIAVIATDENNVRYMTKSNLDGQIIFYLPVGKYTLVVDGANLPPEVEAEKNIPMVVLDAETPKNITIKLIIKPRKIETKKFTSPNKLPNR